ncbi:hypothetical protein H0H92_011949 [Tricholoma furcatifolium]|nr:hypothetical protein H0H92_011949 [Tricholoma furcatifolium]
MPALRTRDNQSRSTLEVSTDAPQAPPTLTIISPTPRAFTFPITHNLADSPYSSPSNSPFEPDLRSLVVSSTPPPLRTLTPDNNASLSSHRRRKSSSDVVEHRPKKGDEDYIKRPENAFILFRRKCCEERQAAPEDGDGPTKNPRQADLSKTISQQWKSLSAEERQYWEELAKEKKKEHAAKHPNYVYRPQRAKDKDGRPKPRKSKSSRRGSIEEEDIDNLSFVVPVNRQRHYGRSASAPTPPPHQFIQVPNVYQMTPSCPTSPSLMPMISRRSSHSDNSEEGLSFDFRPNEGYGQQFGRLEASLQPSEFLQGMFSMAGFRPGELHPLDVSPDTLLPPPHQHQIISPSSATSSSGPPSPYSDTLTPLSAYTQLSPTEHGSPVDLDLQMEMQLQQEYAQFNWSSNNDSWHGESDLLVGDDFDLNAIPPIELGMPKPVDIPMLADGMEYASQSQSPQDYSLMDPIHFEPFIPGQGF